MRYIEGMSGKIAARIWLAPIFLLAAACAPSRADDAQYLALVERIANADGCADASRRVDHLESEILDIKARYWAVKMQRGEPLTEIIVNPGSTISDPVLKRIFYDRMRYWFDRRDIPPLTISETRKFAWTDAAAYSLYRDCGV